MSNQQWLPDSGIKPATSILQADHKFETSDMPEILISFLTNRSIEYWVCRATPQSLMDRQARNIMFYPPKTLKYLK